MEVDVWVPVVGALGGTFLGFWLQSRRADTEYERAHVDRDRSAWREDRRPLYVGFLQSARAARARILGEPVDSLTLVLSIQAIDTEEFEERVTSASDELPRLIGELELVAPREVFDPAQRLVALLGGDLFHTVVDRAAVLRSISTPQDDEQARDILADYEATRAQVQELEALVRDAMRRDLANPAAPEPVWRSQGGRGRVFWVRGRSRSTPRQF